MPMAYFFLFLHRLNTILPSDLASYNYKKIDLEEHPVMFRWFICTIVHILPIANINGTYVTIKNESSSKTAHTPPHLPITRVFS
jgi:hypothetical protein